MALLGNKNESTFKWVAMGVGAGVVAAVLLSATHDNALYTVPATRVTSISAVNPVTYQRVNYDNVLQAAPSASVENQSEIYAASV